MPVEFGSRTKNASSRISEEEGEVQWSFILTYLLLNVTRRFIALLYNEISAVSRAILKPVYQFGIPNSRKCKN